MFRIVAASAAAAALVATGAFAQGTTCTAQSSAKKLAGAAQTSFMKKCETDAKSACAKSATEKKLAGAAKASFERKCVTDAVGTKS
jgi:hypothetical protein